MHFILDAGHGHDTPGKRSGDLQEWQFNRHVLKYVTYELKAIGAPHYILVPEDHDVPLWERTARANKYAYSNGDCIFVSIHGNAYEGPRPERVGGIETYYYSKTGKGIAKVFQRSLVDELGWRNRGIKKAEFYVLKYTSMPAVLLELGFYTNPEERAKMLDAEYQYKMGVAIRNAVIRI